MKPLFRFTGMMWRSERAWILAGAAAAIFALLSSIFLLALSGWFITAAGIAGAAGVGLSFDFFRPSAGIRFFALFRTATRYGERISTHDATLRFLTILRAEVFSSIAEVKRVGQWFRSSELLQRLTLDLDAVDALYLRILLPAITAALALIIVSAALYLFSPAASAAIAVTSFFVALTLYWASRSNRKTAYRLALGSEALRIRAIDLVHAQTDLIFSGGLEAQKGKITRTAEYLQDAGVSAAKADILTAASLSLISTCLIVAILFIGGFAYEAKSIDGPVMAMLVIGALALLEIFAPLRRGALEFGRIVFSAKRVDSLISGRPDTDRRTFFEEKAAVVVRDVTFRHGSSARHVLDSFAMTVGKGERIALVGKSGCGKSTLLSLIAGQIQPQDGQIIISAPTGPQPAIGYLTQQTELFRGSIADNLRVGAPTAIDDQLWKALEAVELATKIRGLESQLDWQLGEAGNGLSGGERRRIALARLLLRNPSIWLLDEPTAGLDDALARRVLANVRRHAPDATWIVSAHHSREIESTDRTIFMGPDQSN